MKQWEAAYKAVATNVGRSSLKEATPDSIDATLDALRKCISTDGQPGDIAIPMVAFVKDQKTETASRKPFRCF